MTSRNILWRGSWCLGAVAGVLIPIGIARAADPKVPPASDVAGRTPVAVLTVGFDYTRPEIAARLARDGEGEIIAWDIPGDDRYPYDAAGDTDLMAGLAGALAATAPVSLLPVRVDPADPASLAKGLAFASRTPARVVIVPMWSSDKVAWETFTRAVAYFSDLRIAVRGCPDLAPGEAVYPRDLGLPNITADGNAVLDPASPMISYVAALPCRLP